MRRLVIVLGYGLAGLVVALGLTLGAFALAGQEIAEPAGPPVFTSSPEPTPDATTSEEARSPKPERTASPSASPDDHGGDSGNSGSGSDEGSGSGDDSGSSSGSGEDRSGSDDGSHDAGHDDDHDDD